MTKSSFANTLNDYIVAANINSSDIERYLKANCAPLNRTTIRSWRKGVKRPGDSHSLEALNILEKMLGLAAGELKKKLPSSGKSMRLSGLEKIIPSERRRLAWHLPDDFDKLKVSKQNEIISWIRMNILQGTTEYRSYHAETIKIPFSIHFSTCHQMLTGSRRKNFRTRAAPSQLEEEMQQILDFKMSTFTLGNSQRNGVWGVETALQKIEHFGLMFGALAAQPKGPIQGLGIPLESLTFGLLAFPKIWDWYLMWRERRRGFFTHWEEDMMRNASAFSRSETGWIRQHPEIGLNLRPINGILSSEEIKNAKEDWSQQCDTAFHHASKRCKEIKGNMRVHRDPFEPILPILEASSPVGEYKKIADEIRKSFPDKKLFPKRYAESLRAYLMIRLGIVLGVRQKNLRQLLICTPPAKRRTDHILADLRRGEMRWSDLHDLWEICIPVNAFKNSDSSFFSGQSFRLLCPDLDGLNKYINEYITHYRSLLLGKSPDPGTFFIKSTTKRMKNLEYSQATFYEAWRQTIQRYGIYNPYTKRGAIKGLLPHGPHNIRDVLATHILKVTGSYEQASYAIQDTPEMVSHHYGRFLPQDKASLASAIVSRAWT